jgi:tetratricopeptide (TPR) repeat protein
MKYSIISLLILLLHGIGYSAPRSDCLDKEFAENKARYYSTFKNNDESYKSWVAKKKEGIALYKVKKNAEALAVFEKAFDTFADADAYYYYGNVLSNVNDIEGSVTAYEIAVKLGTFQDTVQKNLTYYNMACSLSRLKKDKEAFESLDKAVTFGYAAFGYMAKDSDLAYLRSLPEWKPFYAKIVQKYNDDQEELKRNDPELTAAKITKLISDKKVTHEYASSEDAYTFYPDGKVEVRYLISEIQGHKRKGAWRINADKIIIQWTYEEGGMGIGSPTHCASVCIYERYEKFNKTIKEEETIDWDDIGKNEYKTWTFESLKQ